MSQTRTESDTLGPVEVPEDKLWGAQTQRSLQNFDISGERMPQRLIRALATVKKAAALVNIDLEMVEPKVLRVANRSGRPGTVAYREEVLQLKPSETVDLALLDVGTAPFELDPDTRDLVTDGGPVQLRGDVDVLTSSDGARMRAVGDSEIMGYGLVIRLDPGDEILLEGLGSTDERRAAVESAIETP